MKRKATSSKLLIADRSAGLGGAMILQEGRRNNASRGTIWLTRKGGGGAYSPSRNQLQGQGYDRTDEIEREENATAIKVKKG